METTKTPRRPNLTTCTGLSADEVERQVKGGTAMAQNPASAPVQSLTNYGGVLELATRPLEPARPTLRHEDADVLHAVAGAAFRQPPGAPMVFLDDGTHVTAAQVAAACSRALAVAAPDGWGAPLQRPDPQQVEIHFNPSAGLERALDEEPEMPAETADDVPPAPQEETVVDPPAPAGEGEGDQPPAGGGTGEDDGAGKRKEAIPPTQCPYCDADPFGSIRGRDAHIRAKHPDQPVPEHAAA